MAPEHLYPASIDDCVRVTKYILTEGDKHGINKDKCAIAGKPYFEPINAI